jgi:uncharacterized DUF497 family protein
MPYDFEWDETKDRFNFQKHGIHFDEAKTVFDDENSLTIDDPDHSVEDERYIDIGYSGKRRILVVVYTERQAMIRIISARKATSAEKKVYEQTH